MNCALRMIRYPPITVDGITSERTAARGPNASAITAEIRAPPVAPTKKM